MAQKRKKGASEVVLKSLCGFDDGNRCQTERVRRRTDGLTEELRSARKCCGKMRKVAKTIADAISAEGRKPWPPTTPIDRESEMRGLLMLMFE